jgi:hypothetical protein
MGSPFTGPRHRSWASDTIVTAVLFVIVLFTTVITDFLNGPQPAPTYLTGLLGASATAFFAAASSDKNKRDREISATASRAESKADDALGRSVVSVLDIQERELSANRAALKSMKDAIEVKESNGIPVLPETHVAVAQLERQIELLAVEINTRRQQMYGPEVGDHVEVDLDDAGDKP